MMNDKLEMSKFIEALSGKQCLQNQSQPPLMRFVCYYCLLSLITIINQIKLTLVAPVGVIVVVMECKKND